MSALTSPIGFIGLGIMGKGMVRNLLTKLDPSLSFVVWNRSSEACQELSTQFPGRVVAVSHPADVVRQCHTTFSMLSTEEASVEVVSHAFFFSTCTMSRHLLYIEQFDAVDNGVIAGVSEGKIIVDCATLSPERMIAIAAQVTSRGGHFLEAPVSGSKVSMKVICIV